MWIRPVASGANALGDLSGQYWNVAQSNLRTQEGDIARANAAEQNWNRWQANVANLQRSDESTQYDRQAQADAMARRNFEWGIGRRDSQARDQLAAKLDREKIAATLGFNQRKVTQGLEQEANAANNLAQPVSELGSQRDTAAAILERHTNALGNAIAEITNQFGASLIQFDRSKGVNAFKPVGQKIPEDDKRAQAAAFEANAKIASLSTQHEQAANAFEIADRNFSDLEKKLGQNLSAVKRNGEYVIVNLLGQPGKNEFRWTPPPSRGAMPASAESTLRTPGARWNAPLMEVQPQTETAAMPSPAAAPVAPQVPAGSRVMPPGSPFMFAAGGVGSQPAPAQDATSFASEGEARAAGHGSGDIIRIVGVGKVRLR